MMGRTTETRSVDIEVYMATPLAEQIQNAIDQGMDLDSIRRHFHLSESELRDYCSDIIDDGVDEDWSESASGY